MHCEEKDERIFDWPDSDDTISGILRKGINNPKILPKPFKRGIPLKKEFKVGDYQYDVLKWCLARNRGIIAAQMGLGKTFMGICIAALDKKYPMPALIVCPLSLIDNWVNDGFKKFFGNYYKIFVYHPKKHNLKNVSYLSLCEYDYVITTYDCVSKSEKKTRRATLLIEQLERSSQLEYRPPKKEYLKLDFEGEGVLHQGAWSHVIFDESHECSNRRTSRFVSAYSLYALNYWALTGTVERNSSYDLWSQLMICHIPPGIQLGSKLERSKVVRQYSTPEYIYKVNYEIAKIKLPPLNRQSITIDFDPEHYKIYLDLINRLEYTLRMFELSMDRFSSILALFTKLRLFSISPKLIDPQQTVGAKVRKIVELVKQIVARGEKVVINSAFVTGLTLVKGELEKSKITCTMMDGSTPSQKRQAYIDEFKDKTSVFLTSYKVGGVGLNLQFANNWISLEPWWNESVHRQGLQRIWRPGQTKPCNAFFVLCKGMESAVMKMAGEKQRNIDLTEKTFDKVSLDKDMIRRLIRWQEGDFSAIAPVRKVFVRS